MDWRKGKEEQMLREALEALGLSEKNKKLAKRFLAHQEREEVNLQKEAEKQNFYEAEKASLQKSTDYIKYCEKEQLTEEMGRFVQFAAAVGGSTVYYILDTPYKRLEWLSASQQAAVLAEMAAWEETLLNRGNLMLLFSIGEKNPRALRKALGLCRRRGCNVKILLQGIYLYYVKPRGVIVGKYIRETEYAAELSESLLRMLIGSLSLLFPGGRPGAEELEGLKSFAEQSEPSSDFPDRLHSLLRARRFSGYLLKLLGSAAFLAIEHSERFVVFLRILTVMDMQTVLDACLEVCGNSWFGGHLELVENVLPVPMKGYVQWCTAHKMAKALARVSVRCPEAIEKAAASLPAESYQYLLSQMKLENAELYQELNLAFSGVSRIKMAAELTSHYTAGRSEAKRYLLGSAGPEDIYPFVKEWRAMDQPVCWDYSGERKRWIASLKKNQEQQMYQRAVVLEGLCLNALYFSNYHEGGDTEDTWHGSSEERLTAILAVFEKEKIKVRYQTELLEQICCSGYTPSDRQGMLDACVRVLIRKKDAWGNWYVTGLKDGSELFRSLCIRVLGSFGNEYQSAVLSCSQDSSAQVRDTLVDVCTDHREWETEIRSLLDAPRARQREVAAQVLHNWGMDAGKMEQKNQEELMEALLKDGRKRKVSWACENMPKVHKKDGMEASEEELAALLLCYADFREPGISREAGQLAEIFQKDELSVYMERVLKRWIQELDADSRQKWVLSAAAVHGGSEGVSELRTLIEEFPKKNRKMMAAEAVKALALNGSFEALSCVERLSQKSRYEQIREAAAYGFSHAAARRGITEEELSDRMVPDLGFDGKEKQLFDYGGRSFQVSVTPVLTLEICDKSGKVLKNMPVPGKKDDPVQAKAAYEAFKQLKKQMKAVAEDQKIRMEQVFLTGRRWSTEQWKELFVKKTVMHPFASGLIWGTYEEERLTAAFRCMEDKSLIRADRGAYELPKDSRIGLVHPIELSEKERSVWKEQLADHGFVQPIIQLERPIFCLTEEEKKSRELERFGGIRMNGRSLCSRLLDMGWLRGPLGDGGIYDSFYRTDGPVGAELSILGCHAAQYEEETVLYTVCFYRTSCVRREKGIHEVIKKQDQYRPGELSPGYVSEILLQLAKAVGEIRERLPYPECRDEKQM